MVKTGGMRCLCIGLVLLAICAACSRGYDGSSERGMYYWSTTFDLDSVKQKFISDHNVKRLYVRYFDVTADDKGEPKPNATIAFGDEMNADVSNSIPDGVEIVPVVYILNECMGSKSKMPMSELADKLLKRVLQMNETHGLGKVREIQIDCDWTGATRGRFYEFLTELKKRMAPHGIELSVTVRLHQLSQPAPPADKGILMVYNTGDMSNIKEEKPILDAAVVKRYARYLRDYDLPLGAAYPVYKWNLLFRNGNFVDIIHYDGELPIMPGDSIVSREVTVQDVMDAKHIVENVRPDCKRETILFDLNLYNISRYKDEQIESFFN